MFGSIRKYGIGLVFGICLITQILNSQELIHLASNINTNEDEFLPSYENGNLYFGRTYLIGSSPIQKFQVYKATTREAVLQSNSENNSLITSKQLNEQYISFSNLVKNQTGSHRFFMHAVIKKESRRSQFFSKSTKYHDFHPALSPDATYMVFVSDRPGGIGTSDTTTDLYITFKLSDGNWSEPYNLGDEINSTQNEISPFIDNNNNLYFSSKKFGNGNWNYDIYKAEPIGKGKWQKPELLGYNINTEFNETGVFFVGDSIYFASDRPGGINNPNGFKNYDLYCCLIPEKTEQKSVSGIEVILQNDFGKEFSIDFGQYKVPFFVTGYYYPNTSENLKYLRERFKDGTYGINPATKHIANPDLEILDYDKCASIVDNAIDVAVDETLEQLQGIDINSNSLIEITFTGYADSRPILNNAIYDGKQIRSSNPLFVVDKFSQLDNLLLSKLRAYYTSELFISKMDESDIFKKYRHRILISIKGNGSDIDSELPEFEKRRVIITMNIEEKKLEFKPLKTQINTKNGFSHFKTID